MPPAFLTLDEITDIHRDQIARYGGPEGIRNWGMLQSAIAMPAAALGGQFLHADLCEMAAAVLSVARGETPKSAVAEFFRAHTAPARGGIGGHCQGHRGQAGISD